MASATPTIAVFGGTGQQGGAVVDALLERGARVRALVRNPHSERAAALTGRGVELATIDLNQPDTLVDALTGVDAFFFMTTPPGTSLADALEETRQGIALADAAAAAAVTRVVYSSVGGAERNSGVPHFESKRRVELHLQQTGLRATVTRPVVFMENFAFLAPTVEDGVLVLRMPLPDGIPLQLIAVRDLGRINAAIALGEATINGDAIEFAGDARTGTQMAQAFGQHTGLPARYEALPVEVLGDDEDAQAMFRWFAETPAYQADIAATRAIEPDLQDLPTWLKTTGWQFRAENASTNTHS